MSNLDQIPVSIKRDLPNRTPFFYGWIILAAGTFGIIMTGPGQTYSVSIFIEFIIKDLELNRTLVSTLYSLGTLIGGFSLPFWGRQIDQREARKLAGWISLLFGLSCIFMGFIQNAWMLALGFILIRMLGQGSLGLISQTVINQWWVRRRGMVMGISGLLMSLLGMGAFPLMVYALISAFDWRASFIILGMSVLLLMMPVGLLFFRNKPEEYQLHPDGVIMPESSELLRLGQLQAIEANWTLKEAMKTSTFWILVMGTTSFSIIGTGIFFHLVSIFETHGLDASLAASVFIPVSIAAALGTLFGGYLADHVPLKYLIALSLVMQAISLFSVRILAGPGTAILFGLILGASMGISRPVGTVIWPAFYGRANLGSIYGFITAIGIVGAAVGPLPFGFVYDRVGSYQPVLVISAIISILFASISLGIRKPVKKSLKII
jgi:MFS family permease